jgi:hypothetical protein
MAMFPARARDEFEARLARAIEKYPDVSHPGDAKVNAAVPLDASNTDGSKPAAGDETQSDSVPPSSAAPTGGGGEPPMLIERQPAPPPPRVESAEEKMARVNSAPVPAHYLKSTEP